MTLNASYGPLERIDGPPPIRPRYGLLQTAESTAAGVRVFGPAAADAAGIDRWVNGVQVYPYPPDPGFLFDACVVGGDSKEGGATPPLPIFAATTVYMPETCTASHVWNQEEFQARARVAMEAVESGVVAREFLAGDKIPSNPHLADGNGVFPDGSNPTSAIYALALLEAVIAASRKLGLIHCSPLMATMLRDKFAIDDRDGVLRTINGNVVVPDAGYGGLDQTGANVRVHPVGKAAPAGTQEWMFCSGPVDVRQSNVFVMPEAVAQALDRGTGATNNQPNAITYRVERYSLVTWDTVVQGAVLADPCRTTC